MYGSIFFVCVKMTDFVVLGNYHAPYDYIAALFPHLFFYVEVLIFPVVHYKYAIYCPDLCPVPIMKNYYQRHMGEGYDEQNYKF